MDANEIVKHRRIQLGLSREEVAFRSELGDDSYRDVEYYSDECLTNVPLRNLESMCSALILGLDELFPSIMGACGRDLNYSEVLAFFAGTSATDFEEKTGYDAVVLHELERDFSVLGDYPMDFVARLSAFLSTTPHAMIELYRRHSKEPMGDT